MYRNRRFWMAVVLLAVMLASALPALADFGVVSRGGDRFREVTGVVESISNGKVTVSGQVFDLSAVREINAPLAVGAQVVIKLQRARGGTWQVAEVSPASSFNASSDNHSSGDDHASDDHSNDPSNDNHGGSGSDEDCTEPYDDGHSG